MQKKSFEIRKIFCLLLLVQKRIVHIVFQVFPILVRSLQVFLVIIAGNDSESAGAVAVVQFNYADALGIAPDSLDLIDMSSNNHPLVRHDKQILVAAHGRQRNHFSVFLGDV